MNLQTEGNLTNHCRRSAEAVDLLEVTRDRNVSQLVKTYYDYVFGITGKAEERKRTSADAVNAALDILKLNPEQKAKVFSKF